uniref:Uncharacterized protein n=1 Tax=Strigamia maritima TaxID=126957 RepID=T1J2Q9_STRMM
MDYQTGLSTSEKIKLHYMTIFAQCFSPCGKYLVAANNYGKIAVFNIGNILNPDSIQVQDKELKLPRFSFQGHDGPIYALTSTKQFLISAGVGDIIGWAWSDILNKQAKVAWTLSVPQRDLLGKPETNAIVLGENEFSTNLFSAGGDNNVYEWDLESGSQKTTFQGHTDYIHCLATSNQNECISGSEDGSVRIWDLRKPQNEAILLEPYKKDKCVRPKFGKWIGCVALDSRSDWLACGGGPALTLWHMGSFEPTTVYESVDATLACCAFYDDLVIAGGGDSNFYQMNINGNLKSKIPTSAPSIYSISTNILYQNELASVAGTSYKIDVCPSFKYRDFVLYFT